MSDYRKFWKNDRWKPYEKCPKHHFFYLFHIQNLFQNSANDIEDMVNIIYGFCQKDPNFEYLKSSDFDQILPACGNNS